VEDIGSVFAWGASSNVVGDTYNSRGQLEDDFILPDTDDWDVFD
jgi:hypothetical protein